MKFYQYTGCLVISAVLVTGCASKLGKMSVDDSYLSSAKQSSAGGKGTSSAPQGAAKDPNTQNKVTHISPFTAQNGGLSNDSDMVERFSDSQIVTITADNLMLKDFLHHVFGEVFGINYVLGDGVENAQQVVTLNLQDAVTERKLFQLSKELLEERGFGVRYSEGLFFVQKMNPGDKNNTAFGFGAAPASVPDTTMDILQMVPFQYGSQTSLATTISRFVGVTATPYLDRNMMLVRGKRRDVLRALDFIAIMDKPMFSDRHISLFRPTFVSLDTLEESLGEILNNEGISVSKESIDKAVSLVVLDRLNTLVVFSNSQTLNNRAVFWLEQLDKPADGETLGYYIYQPQYSRAIDLGESLKYLIEDGGQQDSLSRSGSARSQQQQNASGEDRPANLAAGNEDMRMVVDERANSLIFKTSGQKYKELLPMIKRLDVMPRQVALEVVIAEVTLTDRFARGVEFALSRGDYSVNTNGAFGLDDIGGLSYALTGNSGSLNIQLFESDSLVNVLSRPSLVVRDGVEASINVGTEIPVITGQTIDANDSQSLARTNIEYRQTGVELSVTPTVNARGVITLDINQKISNEVEGTTVSGSPSIFERELKTEVIAEDGQMVILGGLISENRSEGENKVPVLGDLPLVGELFKSNNQTADKTELVVLVTPKIISSAGEWSSVKEQLQSQLENVKFQ